MTFQTSRSPRWLGGGGGWWGSTKHFREIGTRVVARHPPICRFFNKQNVFNWDGVLPQPIVDMCLLHANCSCQGALAPEYHGGFF